MKLFLKREFSPAYGGTIKDKYRERYQIKHKMKDGIVSTFRVMVLELLIVSIVL